VACERARGRRAALALNISVCPCSVVFFSNSFNKSALSDE
jgi:hypothetical protein